MPEALSGASAAHRGGISQVNSPANNSPELQRVDTPEGAPREETEAEAGLLFPDPVPV